MVRIDLNKFIDPTDELEIRFGIFRKTSFESEVTNYMYNIIINMFEQSKLRQEKTYETITMYNQQRGIKLKKIQNDKGKITIVKKILKSREDIQELGLRIDLSNEEEMDESSVEDISISDIKNRVRTTFYDNPGIIKIDVTKDTHRKNGNIIYQIEAEFLQKPSLLLLNDVINYCGNINRDIHYAQSLVHQINNIKRSRYSSEIIKPLKMPINLKSYNIPFLNNYAITCKPDGITYYMIFTKDGVFLIMDTDFKQISQIAIPELIGTIVLGEYMNRKTPIFFLYNTITYNNVYYGNKSIFEKYKVLNIIATQSFNKLNISILKLFYEKSLLENIKDTFEYTTLNFKPEENDGILIKPINLESHDDPVIFKWKPTEHLTIDFSTYKNPDSTYSIYTIKESNPKFLFTGTKQFPYKQGLVSLDSKPEIKQLFKDGMIIEYSFDINYHMFVPVRHRSDKTKANYITTVLSIWEDINKPITEDLLLNIASIGTLDANVADVKKICEFLNLTEEPKIFDILKNKNNKLYNVFKDSLQKAEQINIQNNIFNILNPYFNT
jgi:hypothetical protein